MFEGNNDSYHYLNVTNYRGSDKLVIDMEQVWEGKHLVISGFKENVIFKFNKSLCKENIEGVWRFVQDVPRKVFLQDESKPVKDLSKYLIIEDATLASYITITMVDKPDFSDERIMDYMKAFFIKEEK